uniref:Insulin-degrading enzyme-like isoform X2 n=1 Tax=Hirondellea gigas TaxID=1518452 RepID=A0A6A7G622_9CRUS
MNPNNNNNSDLHNKVIFADVRFPNYRMSDHSFFETCNVQFPIRGNESTNDLWSEILNELSSPNDQNILKKYQFRLRFNDHYLDPNQTLFEQIRNAKSNPIRIDVVCDDSRSSTSTLEKVVIQSPSDDRSYRVKTLSNGIKALLVSDKSAKKAAASLNVHIGSMSNPSKLPGLAHFLEHMLFLGSKKFPKEDQYQEFLSLHGGMSNAYTSDENTVFFFEVNCSGLSEALKLFCQMFVAPLLTDASIDREKNAVNNEFEKNIQQDGWRTHLVTQEIIGNSHPFGQFSCGNNESLKFANRNDLTEFLKLYKQTKMTLVILGNESLEKLENLSLQFQEIPKSCQRQQTIPEFPSNPFNNCINHWINIIPVCDLRTIQISWPISSLTKVWANGNIRAIQYCLNYKGNGSMLALLKSFGFANGLSCGIEMNTTFAGLFSLEICLTVDGLYNIEKILEIVYSYLFFLGEERNDSKWFPLCQMISKLNDLNFKFLEKCESMGYVSALTTALHRYPSGFVLKGPFTFDVSDEMTTIQDAKSYFKYLIPQNSFIILQSKNLQPNKEEKWFKTKYSIQEFTFPWKNSFFEDLRFPNLTDFCPNNDELIIKTESPNSDYPQRIDVGDPNVYCWHKLDDVYSKPNAIVTMEFVRNENDSISTEDQILSSLSTLLINDFLSSQLFDLEIIGMSHCLRSFRNGIAISFSGYNSRLSTLFEKIIDGIRSVQNGVNIHRICKIVECYERALKNVDKNPPYKQAMQNQRLLMEKNRLSSKERLLTLENVKQNDLQKIIPEFIEKIFFQTNFGLQIMIYGNILKNEAKTLTLNIINRLNLSNRTIPREKWAKRNGFYASNTKSTFCIEKSTNIDEENSANILYFQIGEDQISMRCCLLVLGQILKNPAFDVLRTKEQLGYLVWTKIISNSGVMGFEIVVQSSSKCPKYLKRREEVFLQNFRSKLQSMKPEKFKKYVEAISVILSKKPENLSLQAGKFWSEISRRRYQFDILKDEISTLKKMEKSNVLFVFENSFLPNGEFPLRKVSFGVFGKNSSQCDCGNNCDEAESLKICDVIAEEIETKTRIVYPSLEKQ